MAEVPHPLLAVFQVDWARVFPYPFSTFLGRPTAELSAGTAAAIIDAKEARAKLVTVFLGERPLEPARVIEAATEALKHSIQMTVTQMAGVTSGAVVIKEDADEFAWTSVLNRGPRTGQWTSPYSSLDTIFTANALATGYVNMARELLASDPSVPNMIGASKLLRSASGVYEFMIAHLVPLLRSRGGDVHPPEVLPPVLLAMSSACLAMAQQCAIGKAALEGASNKNLARLCSGAVQLYEAAERHLATLREKDRETVDMHVTSFIRVFKVLAGAMGLKYLGLEAYAADECAKAIGYMSHAKARLETLSDLAYILPEGVGLESIQAETREITKLQQDYDEEGRIVYFVTADMSVEPAPPAVIMKTAALDMEIPEPLRVAAETPASTPTAAPSDGDAGASGSGAGGASA